MLGQEVLMEMVVLKKLVVDLVLTAVNTARNASYGKHGGGGCTVMCTAAKGNNQPRLWQH